MKLLGIIFISLGIALFLFAIYSFITKGNKIISPVPEDKGVKVIFITPSK